MTPIITTTDEEVIIRIPKVEFERLVHREKPPKKKVVDFSYLIGALADVPEFKGKTSVEVQHMIPKIWAEKVFPKKSSS